MKLRTACNRDCPDACGIVATVEDGRVVRLEGDPEHPVTRGFLCYRTSRFLLRQYDAERLTRPLIRRNGELEPAGWDEALDVVTDTLRRIRDESGPGAILHYRSGGSMGLMKHVTDRLFERLGPVAVKSGDICSGAGEAAQELDFGVSESHDLFDLRNSRTIVLWGKNVFVSNVHLLPLLRELREDGTRVVLIDPVHHRGVELSDAYLQPRPGGDPALALGLARWLFDHDAVDPGAPGYCDRFEAFRALATSQTVEHWAGLADVAAEEIDTLGRAYADGPSAILVGWGLQRRRDGGATVRLLDALGAISGNLGVPGGGVSFYFKRRGGFDLSFTGGLDAAPRTIPEALLGPGILAAREPEIRAVWVTGANPVAMLPESETTARALRTRELTVVVDSFLTDTARAAHVVLPTTTMLEDDDLVGAFGHHWLAHVRPVVEAPEGVRTDYQVSQELARRFGLGEEFERDVETWQRTLLGRAAEHGVTLERLREAPRRNPLAERVLFEGRRFETQSGKVNLIADVDPVAPQPSAERPLFLMALSSLKSQASQWAGPRPKGPARAVVHPDAAPGFAEGDVARVESEIGSLEVTLAFDARQRRDVLLMDKGGWLSDGSCANALVPACETDIGGGARLYETTVRIVPADASAGRNAPA